MSRPRPLQSFEYALGRANADRPRWLLALSLLSMFTAASAALITIWITSGVLFCTVTERLSGSNVPVAAKVVLGACAFASFVSIFVRERPLLLSLMLSLAACALLTGIVLVARDSAVTTMVESCSFFGTSTQTVTEHVWYLYVVWGGALAVLLFQLRRAIRFCAAPRWAEMTTMKREEMHIKL